MRVVSQLLNSQKSFHTNHRSFPCCSQCIEEKSAAREGIEDAVEASKNADLKKDFNKVMNKTTHVASIKKAPKQEKTDKTHFMDAVKKYRVGGSGRALMEQVAEIGSRNKRRKMF